MKEYVDRTEEGMPVIRIGAVDRQRENQGISGPEFVFIAIKSASGKVVYLKSLEIQKSPNCLVIGLFLKVIWLQYDNELQRAMKR